MRALLLLLTIAAVMVAAAESALSQFEESSPVAKEHAQPTMVSDARELRVSFGNWSKLSLLERQTQLRTEPNETLLMRLVAEQVSYDTELEILFGKFAKNMPQWQTGAKENAILYLAKAARNARNKNVLQQIILICLENLDGYQYFKCIDPASSKRIEVSVTSTQSGASHIGHFDYSQTLAVEASETLVRFLSDKSIRLVEANKMLGETRKLLENARSFLEASAAIKPSEPSAGLRTLHQYWNVEDVQTQNYFP